MPIRIEHQPSAFAVGVAGYATGRGAARERQGKYALDLFQDQQRFQQQQDMLNQRNQWLDDRDAKNSWETMPNLSKIPDWVDAQTRKDLADRAAAIRDTRRKFGWDDPNARQMDRDLIGQYEDIIGRLTPPSEAEAWNRGLTYVDEKTGQAFDKPGEGLVPYRGGQRAIDNRSDLATAEQQRKQQAEEANRQYQEDMDNYNDAVAKEQAWLKRYREGIQTERDAVDSVDGKTVKGTDLSGEVLGGRAIAKMQQEGWGYRPSVPAKPTRPSPLGTSGASNSTALSPQPTAGSTSAGAATAGTAGTVGEQPIVVTPDMAAQPVPVTGQGGVQGGVATPGAATPGAAAALRDPNTRAMPIPTAPVGAQGGGAVREDGMIDMATRTVPDWAEEAWPEPINASGKPLGSATPSVDRVAEVMPKITAGMQQQRLEQFTPEMLRQARRIAQTPAGRAALQERYGVDFAMPEEQQQSIGPLDTTQRQHVEAMRGPQGTGEGIPSDAARVAGSVQGAGSLAGRTAGYARRDAGQLGPGQTRTTKYNVTPTAAEREAAMNQRFERANQMQQEREMMARASGIAPPTAGPARPKPTSADVAVNQSKRKSKESARSNAVAAQGIREGIDRAQRLGKPVPAVQRAILAALTGDVTAQKALDERGIRWRT